jgi:hypothetical protein
MRTALVPSFRISDDQTLALGNTMLTALTGNSYFPTPSPGLATVQAARNAFSVSLSKAKYGGREDKAQKNADKKALIKLLRNLCNYINSIAQGNLVILSTCGCPLSKEPQPIVLGKPAAKAKNGASGELILFTPAVKGAVAYKHQYTTDTAAGMWPEILSTKAACKITDLQPGQEYSMRIVVIGTNNQVSFSDVVTKMVA